MRKGGIIGAIVGAGIGFLSSFVIVPVCDFVNCFYALERKNEQFDTSAICIVVIIVCAVVGLIIGIYDDIENWRAGCNNIVINDNLSSQLNQYISTGSIPYTYYQKIGQDNKFDAEIYEAVRICKENILHNIKDAERKGKNKRIFAGGFLHSGFPTSEIKECKVRFFKNVYVSYTNYGASQMIFKILSQDREESYKRITPPGAIEELGRLSNEPYNVMQYASNEALTEIEKAFNSYGLSVSFSSFKVEGKAYWGKMM
jgi:hypothetical protein